MKKIRKPIHIGTMDSNSKTLYFKNFLLQFKIEESFLKNLKKKNKKSWEILSLKKGILSTSFFFKSNFDIWIANYAALICYLKWLMWLYIYFLLSFIGLKQFWFYWCPSNFTVKLRKINGFETFYVIMLCQISLL